MQMKRCKQCGMLKEAEDFRPYTYARDKVTSGRHTICRACERINANYSRLKKADQDVSEFEELYRMLEAQGFKTPLRKAASERALVHDLVVVKDFYSADVVPTTAVPEAKPMPAADIPEDIAAWLAQSPEDWKELGLDPEYLQETVYEMLKETYRPLIGFDYQHGVPIYDNTYREPLLQLLKKFDAYEEEMC